MPRVKYSSPDQVLWQIFNSGYTQAPAIESAAGDLELGAWEKKP
jgi:hypothetical protein